MNATIATTLDTANRFDIADALYRLGAGIDENSAELLESAVTADALIDFGLAARSMGIDGPVLMGRDAIVSTLTAAVGLLDTRMSSPTRVSRPKAMVWC